MDSREAAWAALHEALPARLACRPGDLRSRGRHAWSATAHGPLPGGGKHPQIVAGTGPDGVAALRDLDDRLRVAGGWGQALSIASARPAVTPTESRLKGGCAVTSARVNDESQPLPTMCSPLPRGVLQQACHHALGISVAVRTNRTLTRRFACN